MADLTELKNRAEKIRNETQAGANTAERVGGVMLDTVKEIEKIPSNGDGGIGRLDIDHTDTTFVSGDLNTYMEVDDTGGEVTLDIPDSFGDVGDAMIVRKIGDVNDLIITAAGSDSLVGGNKVETQYHIIHLYKVTATRWNATGGVE